MPRFTNPADFLIKTVLMKDKIDALMTVKIFSASEIDADID